MPVERKRGMAGDDIIAAVFESFAGIRHGYDDAVRFVPRVPGLYAFYGKDRACVELGLSPAFDDEPLYAGKAERSLDGRDVGTHLAAGRTG